MRLTYFSPVPWNSYEQRPHYFAYDFLASGGTAVEWVDPYPARLPAWRDLARLDSRARQLTLEKPAGLSVHRAAALPIDPLPSGARINLQLFWQTLLQQLSETASGNDAIIGVGRPTELALAACSRLPAAWRFYDAMDDFPEFYRGRSRTATARVEAELAARVDRIIVSSTYLGRKFATVGRPLTRIANAYDMTLLPPFEPGVARTPHIGFIGCLGSWLDWDVVIAVATAVAPAPVTLAGPLAVQPSAALPSNVRLLPPCSQTEGIALLRTFSAGLIPFKQNALTAGVDPIKYYQYRGMGLPVLTTRFGEMAERTGVDGVFFLDDAAAIMESIAKAAKYGATAESVARVRTDDDWRARFRAADLWTSGVADR